MGFDGHKILGKHWAPTHKLVAAQLSDFPKKIFAGKEFIIISFYQHWEQPIIQIQEQEFVIMSFYQP